MGVVVWLPLRRIDASYTVAGSWAGLPAAAAGAGVVTAYAVFEASTPASLEPNRPLAFKMCEASPIVLHGCCPACLPACLSVYLPVSLSSKRVVGTANFSVSSTKPRTWTASTKKPGAATWSTCTGGTTGWVLTARALSACACFFRPRVLRCVKCRNKLSSARGPAFCSNAVRSCSELRVALSFSGGAPYNYHFLFFILRPPRARVRKRRHRFQKNKMKPSFLRVHSQCGRHLRLRATLVGLAPKCQNNRRTLKKTEEKKRRKRFFRPGMTCFS